MKVTNFLFWFGSVPNTICHELRNDLDQSPAEASLSKCIFLCLPKWWPPTLYLIVLHNPVKHCRLNVTSRLSSRTSATGELTYKSWGGYAWTVRPKSILLRSCGQGFIVSIYRFVVWKAEAKLTSSFMFVRLSSGYAYWGHTKLCPSQVKVNRAMAGVMLNGVVLCKPF